MKDNKTISKKQKFIISDYDDYTEAVSEIEKAPYSNRIFVDDTSVILDQDLVVKFYWDVRENGAIKKSHTEMPLFAALRFMDAMKIYIHTNDGEPKREMFEEIE